MEKVRKYSLIKKILVPIIVLAIFLLPISPSLEIKNKNLTIKVETKKILAATVHIGLDFTVNVDTSGGDDGRHVIFDIKMEATDKKTDIGAYRNLNVLIYKTPDGGYPTNDAVEFDYKYRGVPKSLTNWTTQFDFDSPIQGNKYYYLIFATDGPEDPEDLTYGENMAFVTAEATALPFTDGNFVAGGEVVTGITSSKVADNGLDLHCGLGFGDSIGGCVAELVFLVFQLAALIGKLAGLVLDFFVYYSTNSGSYVSGFVTKGWGAIRDVANIFFIIALLYIAIKTILNLGGASTKKMISTIIIVALLINFSLFFTRVIIDGSNILAKVFYNNIESKDKNGVAVGATGEKSISVGLMSLFNPQNIITKEVYEEKGGIPLYIFTTILLTFIVLYAAWIFFSVAILFVSRVVMLWLSMIFAPIAFASYTLPFDIPGLGHKEWWKNLLENAFLAPIFIFFLYIIVMFAGFLKEIVTFPEGADFMQKVMSVVIPFVILAVLLMKAKDMAIKYSGEMGKAFQKAGAMVGGVALGAATGGAAMLGRQTIGRAAANISEKQGFKDWAAKSKFGGAVLKGTRKVGEGSFDARGIKVMGKDLRSTGLKVGKNVNKGGFTKSRKDYVEGQEKFASSLVMSERERYSRGLTFVPGESDAVRLQKETDIKAINTKRTLVRADTVQRGIPTASKKIAATKIRESERNREKKLKDAAIAFATPPPTGGGGGGAPTGGGGGGAPTGGGGGGAPTP